MKTVLIIDADRATAEMAQAFLSGSYESHAVSSRDAALERLAERSFDIILMDVSDGTGCAAAESVAAVSAASGPAALVCCAEKPEPDLIVGAARRGAAGFVAKPFDAATLRRTLCRAAAELLASPRPPEAPSSVPSCHPAGAAGPVASGAVPASLGNDEGINRDDTPFTGAILGDSEPIRQLKRQIRLFAQHDSPVLILGESGTGKELVAAEVHALSSRRLRRFVPVDCASIPETLAESELFGTVRGAFTGSVERRGVFEEADGGTVFLDEVGELTPAVQAKLLRALECRSGTRVGSRRATPFDVRLISATNSPLFSDPRRFRPELLNRLNTLVIRMPPLRSYPEDIPVLAKAFLSSFSPGKEFTAAALDKLQAWVWPGNCRELKNTVHRAAVLSCRGAVVDTVHIETEGEAGWGMMQGRLF